MKLLWLTDIHLNFLDKKTRTDFYQEIITKGSDAILISGDIAEAPSIASILTEMVSIVQKPIYFVLGNHDYYHGSIDNVRQKVITLTQQQPLLYWLPKSGPQKLNNKVIVLGHDGFADGRYGDYINSRVILNDSRMIVDLWQSSILGRDPLLKKMQQLADQEAHELKSHSQQAINTYQAKEIIVLTHVPPFREVCMHEGQISNDDYLPFFASKVTGAALRELAAEHKEVNFLVLCGHTHSKGSFAASANLLVKAGSATYGQPIIQEVFSF